MSKKTSRNFSFGRLLGRVYWFLLFFMPGMGLFAYQIVFVHLGHTLPPYLDIAVRQARLFNPDADLILIANQEALSARERSLEGIRIIAAESLNQTLEHRIFLSESRLDKGFREGFWFYATERLFYLNDLICQYDLKNTFHLENDNLLYVNLGELLPVFVANYPGMAIPFEQDSRGGAGFVFLANSFGSQALAKYLAAHARSGQSEMYLLNSFKNQFGNQYIEHLPVISIEYGKDHNPLKDPQGRVDQLAPENYSRYFDQFQSLFDMCSYGQYIGGIDPRNGPDGPGYVNPLCVFNCTHMTFEWKWDDQNRRVPYVTYKGITCRINNLHIHSKNLERYASVK